MYMTGISGSNMLSSQKYPDIKYFLLGDMMWEYIEFTTCLYALVVTVLGLFEDTSSLIQ